MNEGKIGLDFQDPGDAAFIAAALVKEGIQAEVAELGKADRPPKSKARSRLFVQPEHRDRVEALFVELQIYQYRTGWGGPYPSYKTPLAEFARQIKVLRISHRVHIGSLIAFFRLS